MAKLRNVQFYRNGEVSPVTGETVVDLKSAYKKAEQDFIATGKHNNMLDGEILLYRFSYDSKVHTLVGVVHATVPQEGGQSTKSLEVLANYDMLGGEISAAITTAINALDAEVTNTSNDITVKVTQTDGKLTAVEVTDTLKDVAHTGAAADVSIADSDNLIAATTVEGALAEIAKEIDAMDLTATDVVALNTGKTALQAGKISETDGKVAVAAAETLVEFNQAISSDNKVATMADVTAAAVSGQESIVVGDAPQGSTTGKVVSLKLAAGENVLSQTDAGLKTTIALSYDSATTKIKLTGIDGANLGEIDATDFVKDGILQDVVIVEGTGVAEEGQTQVLEDGHRYFKFTYKTVYYDENGETTDTEKVVYLDVESLVDSYTSGNEWIVIDQDTNTISHKTVKGLITGAFGANTADATADAAGESVEFKVPSFTVDAAGHVTVANEKTIKVALPATRTADSVTVVKNETLGLTSEDVQSALEELQGDINAINAVNWNGDGDGTGTGEIIVNDTDHTISHKQHTFEETESTNATAVKSVVIPQLTINDYGHVTAIDNKTFTIDCNITTVSGTADQIVVTPTVTEGSEDVNYTVSLAGITVVQNVQKDDYVANKGTTEAPKNEHTRVENITVDAYGRVTAYTLTTVEENWDCGSW